MRIEIQYNVGVFETIQLAIKGYKVRNCNRIKQLLKYRCRIKADHFSYHYARVQKVTLVPGNERYVLSSMLIIYTSTSPEVEDLCET